jgi:hypothetical protein
VPDFTYAALAETGARGTETLTANRDRETAGDASTPRAGSKNG